MTKHEPKPQGSSVGYSLGYIAGLEYAIEIAGQPTKEKDAREQIIDRLSMLRNGIVEALT